MTIRYERRGLRVVRVVDDTPPVLEPPAPAVTLEDAAASMHRTAQAIRADARRRRGWGFGQAPKTPDPDRTLPGADLKRARKGGGPLPAGAGRPVGPLPGPHRHHRAGAPLLPPGPGRLGAAEERRARRGRAGTGVTTAPPSSRAALRYYGGKHSIAPWIVSHFPPHICYVEPFGGALSVLLHKPPARIEVANDADRLVVTFFRVLRERPDALRRAIALTPYAREECRLACTPEAHDPDSGLDELERARRFYVQAWQSRHGAPSRGQMGWRYERQLGAHPHRGGRLVPGRAPPPHRRPPQAGAARVRGRLRGARPLRRPHHAVLRRPALRPRPAGHALADGGVRGGAGRRRARAPGRSAPCPAGDGRPVGLPLLPVRPPVPRLAAGGTHRRGAVLGPGDGGPVVVPERRSEGAAASLRGGSDG